MRNAIIEVEDDDDFLAQVAAAEADALSAKRRKTTATATATVTKTANISQANTNKEEGVEGTYTAALRGSRSLLFQQQISRASGRVKGLVAGNSINNNNNNNVFANPEIGGGGSTVGGGSCFKCGKSGHWARDCDANSIAVVDPLVPEKACPCGLGSCIVLTANTEKNRGRQFYKCPLREENGGCGFFEWCDKNIGTDNTTVRSQSYASNQSHASNPSIPELSCLCGAGPCLILTAKTGKNIGQMFYRCPANQGSSCGFFKWCNDHTIQGGPSASVYAAKVQKANEMSSNSFGVRSGSPCFKCGKDGHWAKDCPAHSIQKPADHRGGNTATPGACYKCGNPGHWAKDCSG